MLGFVAGAEAAAEKIMAETSAKSGRISRYNIRTRHTKAEQSRASSPHHKRDANSRWPTRRHVHHNNATRMFARWCRFD